MQRVTTNLSEGTVIYSNFTNYLYEVDGVGSEAHRFLLFNPSTNYWITTDRIGKTLIEELPRKNLAAFKHFVMHRYGLTEADFERDVLPFVRSLIEMRFFTVEETPAQAGWVPETLDLHLPGVYPFNDIFISLTDTCTLDCSYCFNKEARMSRLRRASAPRLSDQTILKVIEEFRELGGVRVCFTGGEPTLHPRLLDFCEMARGIGLASHFITNGTRLRHLDADRLVQAVDAFAVSVNTVEDSVAARLWGTGRYRIREDVLVPLRNIADKARTAGKRLGITIKPTVTAVNLVALQSMVEEVSKFLAGSHLSWDFGRYEPIGNPETDQALGVTQESYNERVYACIETVCRSDATALRYVLSRGGKFLPHRGPKILPCVPSFFVTNTGEVYPCQGLELDEFCLGTVWSQTLREMFDHTAFSNLRTKMTVDDIEVCGECELRYQCTQHCHGYAQKAHGRTTAFIHEGTETCRAQAIKRLWLETQLYER